MARIRTVKPEFWTDEALGECSPSARLLFIATWNFADDSGNLDRSSKQLKAQAFPYDSIDCEPLVHELLAHGLLIEYESGGKKYLHINNFLKHQKIDKPTKPRIPFYEPSLSTPRILPEPSRLKGREGNGKERKGSPRKGADAPDEWFVEFKATYPPRAGAQGWSDALKSGRRWLAKGHTPAELLAGTQRYARFIAAAEQGGTVYVKQASTFLGDGKHFLEEFPLPAIKQTAMDRILAANGGTTPRTFEHEQENSGALETTGGPVWGRLTGT